MIHMKDKRLSLEIEKGLAENNSNVGISLNVEITDDEGSRLSGSVLLIEKCSTYEMLYKEISRIKEELDVLRDTSRDLFETEPGEEKSQGVNEDLSVQEIWDFLSTIKDPEALLVKFNSMSSQKRFEVADYVLSNCNIFSGPASSFAMRYDSEEGIIK